MVSSLVDGGMSKFTQSLYPLFCGGCDDGAT